MTDATILALYQVKNTWKMQYSGMLFAVFLRRMTVGYARNEKRQKTAILLVKY